jgi:hypothetical protein
MKFYPLPAEIRIEDINDFRALSGRNIHTTMGSDDPVLMTYEITPQT